MKRMYDLIHEYFVFPRETKWLLDFAYSMKKVNNRMTPAQALFLKRLKAQNEIEIELTDETLREIERRSQELFVQGRLRA